MNNSSGQSLIYLLAPLLGWMIAHIIKFFVNYISSGGKEKSLMIFVRAGGMPSSHTAVMISLLTVIGFKQGLESEIFGLAATVTAIIIYDSLNVRRSVGEQGDALKKLVANSKKDNNFFIAYGHNITEVTVGALIGFLVGAALLQIL